MTSANNINKLENNADVFASVMQEVRQERYKNFAVTVADWQKKHGRHDLPWQKNRTPYTTWLSEIMLQQTQVAAVIPYYQRFLQRFPDVETLARAKSDSVLAQWSGLGYYARARNLQQAAKQIQRHGFPQDMAAWQQLPGVGKSTAAAISVFCHSEKQAILDGNVKRVLARVFTLPFSLKSTAATTTLWNLADNLLPVDRRRQKPYTQGLMDLGALICTRTKPRCQQCPLASVCRAHQRREETLYPIKSVAVIKPTRRIAMLLLENQGRIVLQKRPMHGIWGGLWSLPEAANKAALLAAWQHHCRFDDITVRRFRHSFSHYHLRASIYICRAPMTAVNAPYRWLTIAAAQRLGLPAPIRVLLTEHYNKEKT